MPSITRNVGRDVVSVTMQEERKCCFVASSAVLVPTKTWKCFGNSATWCLDFALHFSNATNLFFSLPMLVLCDLVFCMFVFRTFDEPNGNNFDNYVLWLRGIIHIKLDNWIKPSQWSLPWSECRSTINFWNAHTKKTTSKHLNFMFPQRLLRNIRKYSQWTTWSWKGNPWA